MPSLTGSKQDFGKFVGDVSRFAKADIFRLLILSPGQLSNARESCLGRIHGPSKSNLQTQWAGWQDLFFNGDTAGQVSSCIRWKYELQRVDSPLHSPILVFEHQLLSLDNGFC